MATSTSPKKAAGNVTLKQIARELGVSHQLVSFALNDSRGVNEDTRRRIKEAAERLGYQRNGIAAAMKSGRFSSVALLLSTSNTHSSLPEPLWNGIMDELGAHDWYLSVAKLPDERLLDGEEVPRLLRESMSDGLLIDYTHRIPPRLLALIEQQRLPAVWINSQQSHDCVFPDDLQAGQRASRHLLQLGHKGVAYADFAHTEPDEESHYSVLERREGVCGVLRAEGAEVRLWGNDIVPRQSPLAFVLEQMRRSDRPSAIVTYGEEISVAMMACAMAGLQVPRDVSLLSFGTPGAQCGGVPLSQMEVPEREVGRRAVAMLQQKIEAPGISLPPQAVTFGWSAGETCAHALKSS